MKQIAIYGAGWIHNMGNSFIQIGSKYTIENSLSNANVHIVDSNPFNPPTSPVHKTLDAIGRLPLLYKLRSPEKKLHNKRLKSEIRIDALADLDAIVLSGVWLTAKYLYEHLPVYKALQQRGVKIIMNGVGGTHYDQKEFDEVGLIIKDLKPHTLITRDDIVFEAYKGVVDRMAKGIDVGFFVNDAFTTPLPMKQRVVSCFDRGPIPSEVPITPDTVITHHAQVGLQYHDYKNHKIFFSEMADDYLSLYANCSTVYSDRVHACVATLAFGNKARLIDETPRAHLFETLGVGNVRNEIVQLDQDVFASKKQQHLDALSEALKDL
jgi:hypothetical protein